MEKCPCLKNLLAYWKDFRLVCCNSFHPGNPMEKINATCPFTQQAVPVYYDPTVSRPVHLFSEVLP